MGIFDWNMRYSVHIQEFDEHHKKLLSMLANLHQSMLDGKGKQIIGSILDELKSYTNYHFKAEEEKMAQFGYPEYEAHKQQHHKLIGQLNDLIENYKNNDLKITSETYQFLKSWLTNHILGEDKKYTAFFKEKGL